MNTHAFANPFAAYNNPFLAPSDDLVEEVVVDASDASYALVATGPAVASEEVESHLDAVEVKVSWGTQVLSLAHLEQGKGFSIGEGADFELPIAKMSLVETRGTTTYAVIPDGAEATVCARGEHPRAAKPTEEIALVEGLTIHITLESVTIEIAQVRAGKKVPVGFLAALASGAAAAIGLSFVGHAAIVATLAMFMPKMNVDDAESISREQVLKMQALMDTAADREQEQLKNQEAAAETAGGGSKGGEPHAGESGAAGTTKPVTSNGHMAFKGNDSHVQLSRKDELREAQEGGFVGILLAGRPETGLQSPWGEESQLGQDSDNKLGNMFGATADDAMGYGVGLWGTGEGGGGKGKGIGIDGVGNTVGGGGGGTGKWGFGPGGGDGTGIGHGPGKGAHQAKAPNVRPAGETITNGHIPPEVIQRIVRQNFGRFRLCYEGGLRSNPSLSGRIVTKFVIGRDGAVSQAADGGSDMPSQEVVSCVVRSFNALSFPAPEGGVATVIYPISLTPGE